MTNIESMIYLQSKTHCTYVYWVFYKAVSINLVTNVDPCIRTLNIYALL